jgi:hypothetical protein
MIARTFQSVLKDEENKTMYTVVAFRRLTYDETLAAVRRFYRAKHPWRTSWLRNQRIKILTDIGLEE